MTSSANDNLLTAVVLVHQHDVRLAKCLKSLEQFPEVLKIELEFIITDFAVARNKALTQVKTPWTFFVDSDEILPDGAYKIIEKAILSNKAEAFSLLRKDIFLGKRLEYAEWGNQKVVRVVRTKETTFQGKVHEVPTAYETQQLLPITIEHYAHHSVGEFLVSVERYAALRATEIRSSKTRLIAELIIYPPGKFIWNMVFLLGFLDGWRGLIYATVMSYHSAMVRIFALGNTLQDEK
ncbi:MAG: hypothetical protein COY80_04545 [Candidatus Pacebacteria bacterium CG_4_10_14_0_8_um_filter_42_14]|nr:MAG: hypothetical protein COY80_04545 [Candidatus Pacebacteria bacterium CG_4_10_14_0_8_um_filter_42_14]